MKFSKSGLKITNQKCDTNEIFSHQLFMQTSLLYRYGAGIYGKHQFLKQTQRKIEDIVRQVLGKYGCIEVEVPTLQPKEIWEKSGRWETYIQNGQMFYCDMKNGTYCLSPTAEEAVTIFAKEHIKSAKDMPITFYQITQKYRNELRARGGMLRSKEFSMMDAYSYHLNEKSLNDEYENIRLAYLEIFSKLSLNVIPVAADNGDMGGKKSEEFMVICPFGEDKILVNKERTLGINKEILERPDYNSYLNKEYGFNNIDELEEVSCIEIGHIFQLGSFYSDKMNITIRNSENYEQHFYMGCYGIGITRLLATICELNSDSKGLFFPKMIASVSVQIIYTEDNEQVADNLSRALDNEQIPYLLDDRSGVSIGTKVKDWQLLGTPYAIIIGKKYTDDQYELEYRKDGTKEILSLSELISFLK